MGQKYSPTHRNGRLRTYRYLEPRTDASCTSSDYAHFDPSLLFTIILHSAFRERSLLPQYYPNSDEDGLAEYYKAIDRQIKPVSRLTVEKALVLLTAIQNDSAVTKVTHWAVSGADRNMPSDMSIRRKEDHVLRGVFVPTTH